jgi:hypothetical protein
LFFFFFKKKIPLSVLCKNLMTQLYHHARWGE